MTLEEILASLTSKQKKDIIDSRIYSDSNGPRRLFEPGKMMNRLYENLGNTQTQDTLDARENFMANTLRRIYNKDVYNPDTNDDFLSTQRIRM